MSTVSVLQRCRTSLANSNIGTCKVVLKWTPYEKNGKSPMGQSLNYCKIWGQSLNFTTVLAHLPFLPSQSVKKLLSPSMSL